MHSIGDGKMKTKMNSKFVLILMILGLVVVLGGCEFLFPPSEFEDRIASFEDELNSVNRSSVYVNFSPNADDYDTNIRSAAFWDSVFNNSFSYTFTNLVINESLMLATGTLQIKSGGLTLSSPDCAFTFEEYGGNTLIRSFSCTGYTTVQQIFPAK